VAYSLHPSYKGAKLSPDQLIIVTDSLTLGSFLPNFFPEGKKHLSSRKKPNPGHICTQVVKIENYKTLYYGSNPGLV